VASKPETNFYTGVHRLLPDSVHTEKMANPYSSGTADVWYSAVGVDCWVEYKFLPSLPVRAPIQPLKLLTELQALWLKERHAEGRNVAVIIGWKQGRESMGIILQDMEWEQPIPVDQFKARSTTRKEIANALINNLEKPCP